MRRAWTSWELRRQMDRNPRGKWMQSWMTVTLHQLLCAHREIEEIHLRRSCMRRGWRSLLTDTHGVVASRARGEAHLPGDLQVVRNFLRPLEKGPEARQKMTEAPNKERALQRTLGASCGKGASPFFFDLALSVTLAATTRAVCSYFDA